VNDQPSPEQTSGSGASALRWPILLGSLGFGILWFVLPIYGRRMGASALEIGGLFSVFSVMVVLLRPLVGRALDRFGRKPFFVAAFICYAGAMALFALASGVAGLYAARVVQGVGSALLWISAYAIATDLVPPGERGRAVGCVDEASARGGMYGTFVGFAVLASVPLLLGWKALFAGYALAAIVACWLAWKRVPETGSPRHSRAKSSQTLTSPLLKLMVIVFVTGASSAMIGPLLMVFLQDRFTTDVGMLALAFIPAALVYSFLPSRLGRLGDRFGRTPLMALGLAGSGLVSLFLPGLPGIGWLTLLWALQALGLAAAAPAEEALVADLTGKDVRGTAYGLYTFAAGLGATFGPLVGGWLYDAVGQSVPFFVNGGVLLAGAVWVLLLLGRRPGSAEGADDRNGQTDIA